MYFSVIYCSKGLWTVCINIQDHFKQLKGEAQFSVTVKQIILKFGENTKLKID